MELHYSIEFFTDWHCGSGLGAGALADAMVIKNEDGMPYIPGKTIKGLVREAVEDLVGFRYGNENPEELPVYQKFMEAFGVFKDDRDIYGSEKVILKGSAFFSNAEIPEETRTLILSEHLRQYLFRIVSATAIDDQGIAVEHSLRRMEVVVPCILEGRILDLPDDPDFISLLTDALKYIKRLGKNRNRGLGRCKFSVLNQSNI